MIFNLLDNTDETGGNGHDTWTDFSKADGDKIDITELLSGQSVSSSTISDYIKVTSNGTDTVISIDRDGSSGTTYESTELLTLKNTDTTLEELLQNNQLLF